MCVSQISHSPTPGTSTTARAAALFTKKSPSTGWLGSPLRWYGSASVSRSGKREKIASPLPSAPVWKNRA